MTLSRIDIRHLRVLDDVSLQPGGAVNLLIGANGAGKTSILEGIYLLGRGRSFRSANPKSFIREGEKCVEVTGWRSGTGGSVGGIRRCVEGAEFRINGKRVNRMSELARAFPVQVVTPRSHEILERGPELRRRFLDWGVFHVEPTFLGLTARYQRVLRQRNEALKTAPRSVGAWDEQLALFGESICHARRSYLDLLTENYSLVAQKIGLLHDVGFSLWPGWAAVDGLEVALGERRGHDMQQGHTSVGPHRADLRIRVAGLSAEARLSRGQQKLLVLALALAQMKAVAERCAGTPVLLLDDLAAELDDEARGKVMAFLRELAAQVFVTSLDENALGHSEGDRLFHVEHGSLTA